MSVGKDTAIAMIDSTNSITRILFWPFIGSPFAIGPLLYSFANGYSQSENHVILYFFILIFLSIMYILFFAFNNSLTNKVVSRFSNRKKGIAEKIISGADILSLLKMNNNRISENEKDLIFIHARNIVKMKIIIIVGLFNTVSIFFFIGFIL